MTVLAGPVLHNRTPCGPTALAALIRQFRDVDAQIRALDAQAAQLADDEDDGRKGDEQAGWDESAL